MLLFFANVIVVAFAGMVVVVAIADVDVVVVVFPFGEKRSGNVFARQRGASQLLVK